MGRFKTVVLINHTAELGGAEFALERLLKSIDREKWNPVVVFGEDGPAAELVRKMSIETYVIPFGDSLVRARKDTLTFGAACSLARWREVVASVWTLSQFLKERAADIVHTNSMKAHVLGGLAAKLAKVPLVWHVRDTVDQSYLPFAAVRCMRALARVLPDRIVTVSHSVAEALLGDLSKTKARVIYDGLDECAFEQSVVPKATPNWRVGMVGRLCAWKGQHVLIEAAALLQAKGFVIDFDILGSPMFGEQKYADGLQKQVQSLGLGRHVHFRGFVHNVSHQLKGWDLCVHASTSPDPCPNVVIEAMAAGVPVVGSDGGGVPELLDGGRCGDLVPMKNSRELAVAIERLLLDRSLRLKYSKMARERATKMFRSERVAQEVEEVWDSLVSNKTWTRRRWRWIEDGLGTAEASGWGMGSGRVEPSMA